MIGLVVSGKRFTVIAVLGEYHNGFEFILELPHEAGLTGEQESVFRACGHGSTKYHLLSSTYIVHVKQNVRLVAGVEQNGRIVFIQIFLRDHDSLTKCGTILVVEMVDLNERSKVS